MRGKFSLLSLEGGKKTPCSQNLVENNVLVTENGLKNCRKMLTKVIVILLICFKLDYTTSLPDIIRIGEDFSLAPTTKSVSMKKKILFSCNTG